MFCPRCGNEMVEVKGTFYCEKGKMDLAPAVAERMYETFILETSKPKDFNFTFGVGGSWFCPKDGAKMIEKDGYIECEKCGLNLNEFIYALIERHIHEEHEK